MWWLQWSQWVQPRRTGEEAMKWVTSLNTTPWCRGILTKTFFLCDRMLDLRGRTFSCAPDFKIVKFFNFLSIFGVPNQEIIDNNYTSRWWCVASVEKVCWGLEWFGCISSDPKKADNWYWHRWQSLLNATTSALPRGRPFYKYSMSNLLIDPETQCFHLARTIHNTNPKDRIFSNFHDICPY